MTDPLDPAARRSLRGGPLARRLALVDLGLYRLLRGRLRLGPLAGPLRAYSRAGEHAALWLVLGAAGALSSRGARRRAWLRGARAVAAAYGLNTLLKLVVRRRRPLLDELPALIATPTALSFPSAHASSSFAAARAYGALAPAAPLYAAAATMAVSRVILGVHYPSDVAAGALLGTAIGSAGR